MPKDQYSSMLIEPYELFDALGVKEEYLFAATLKYLMRSRYNPKTELADLNKALDCLTSLVQEKTNV